APTGTRASTTSPRTGTRRSRAARSPAFTSHPVVRSASAPARPFSSEEDTMRKLVLVALVLALAGCPGHEAATVDLPVAPSPGAIPVATTDLGYTVQLDELRVAVSTIQFTIEGESHADVAPRTAARLAPQPHPGHSAGGEVTGELPGEHILRWAGSTQPALGM